MKKLEISNLETINGGYDCSAGRAYAIATAVWGAMLLQPELLVVSTAITMLNQANGCFN